MTQIARNARLHLVFQCVLLKNRVWISVDAGLWRFRVLFLPQKSVAQFVFGFGVCGATTRLDLKREGFGWSFPFEGN